MQWCPAAAGGLQVFGTSWNCLELSHFWVINPVSSKKKKKDILGKKKDFDFNETLKRECWGY